MGTSKFRPRSRRLFCTTALAVLAALSPNKAVGFGTPDQSQVAVESKETAGKLQFIFRVSPNKGLHINMEGPWKLEIKGHEGLEFGKTVFGKGEMDEKLPGFIVATSAKPSKAAGEVEYTLTAFVCTDDKTQCFRDPHKGKTTWKFSAKP